MISPKTISFYAYRGTDAATHDIFRGGPVKFIAVLDDSIDLTECTSLRLDLRESVTDENPPLATREIVVFSGNTYEFEFSSAETNHNVSSAWLVLTAYYPEGIGGTDDNLDPLYIATVNVALHNSSLEAPLPPNAAVALTQAQADELYLSNEINYNKLLGRYTTGVGEIQEITIGSNLLLSSLGVLSAAGGSGTSSYTGLYGSFGLNVGNGYSVLTPGIKGWIRTHAPGTIVSITLLANQTGSCSVDIRKCSYSDYPVMTSITGAAGLVLNSEIKYENTLLSGYDTSINNGDIYSFCINSCNDIKKLQVIGKIQLQ